MHHVLALLTAALFSSAMFASENPLEKIFLLSLHKPNIIVPDITQSIQLYALKSIIQSMPERIKILHYLAHQKDDHKQILFDHISQCDTKEIDSIGQGLSLSNPSRFSLQAICRGDFLTPEEYSSQHTQKETLFFKSLSLN